MEREDLSYPLEVSAKEALKEIAKGIPALLKLFYRLLRDPRTPRKVKWWIGGTALYLISPINLRFKNIKRFPFQLVNYIDDVVLIVAMIQKIFHDTPEVILHEHWDHSLSFIDWKNMLYKLKVDLKNLI